MLPKNVMLKTRKIRDNYCKICQTFLLGDGSIAHPYECVCGTYEYDWGKNKTVLVTKPNGEE